MDIWLAAVLVAWLPTAAVLALLVGRTVAQSERRERLTTRRLRAGDPVPVLLQRGVPQQAGRRHRVARAHHLAS